jgi:alanine racemase
MSTNHRTTRAWIEVEAASLRRNLRRIRAAVGADVPIIPMVKADAYGLGAPDVVDVLEAEGPHAWGVAAVSEGVALRRHGVERPVIVFSPLAPGTVEEALEARLTVCVSGLDGLEELRRAARRCGPGAAFQVEVDTGMGRAGFAAEAVHEWGPAVRAAAQGDGLAWTGCFTHFHSADEPGGPGMEAQLERFRCALATLAPPRGCLVHVANSAAALRLGAGGAVGGVRPGIFLYGGRAGADLPAPDPVAFLRVRIVLVKDVPAGASVGYGATYRAGGGERWATLAIGYGDGVPRSLGGRGEALVAGRRVPLVGRVSMDLAVANISGLDGVEAGDVATLIGRDGDEEISLDEVAALAGTIPYEILTGLSPRLPRVWMHDELD